MAQSKLLTTGKSSDAPRRQRIDVQMVQNVLLIWLDSNIDSNIDSNSKDCRNTITQLRRVVNEINIFTDDEECLQFLGNITDNKACIIISGSLGQHIVPRVHNMSQVDSVFIFCDNRKYHEQWIQEWSKIKGVFTEITPICEALKQAAQVCEQNAISISFMGTTDGSSKKKLDQIDPAFMYTQILKEIFLTIQFDEGHIKKFIDYCRAIFVDNDKEMENINKLERTYREKTPIWWYTYECFLYPMLNRSLRLLDTDIIVKMGFFISDLHRHIEVEELNSEQFGGHHSGNTFTVYRGQGISHTDFDQMTAIKGGLMSFNNFLSTSKVRNVSLDFARKTLSNPDLVGILFVMTIDPWKSTTPFASVIDVSYFQGEDEVLFGMNSVFRIDDIKPMGENHRLYQVDLTLTSDNDKDLHMLTEVIREETFPHAKGWQRLGLLLNKMGKSETAQKIYQTQLGQTSDDSEKADIYNGLAQAKFDQGEYKVALELYEKSLEILQQLLPPNHPHLASSYNNIGLVYYKMGEYSKALSSFEKTLEILQQSLPPNHPDLAVFYNNIGNVYDSMGEYLKALWSYEKALEIRQQSLPPNHPDLGMSYHNVGLVYDHIGEYLKALCSYEKALEIRQQSLPPNHPDLGMSYNNIGEVYRKMGEYSEALSSYQKALEIWQQSLSPNHPDLGMSYNNMGIVYRNIGDYSKTLWSYEKALQIWQQSLPPNHPNLGMSYNNIGNMYSSMGDNSKALSSHEKALQIRQQSLPPNHPNLASSFNNIGLVYEDMGEYSKARSFYERAVEIGQLSLPPNHPNLRTWKRNIDIIKNKL